MRSWGRSARGEGPLPGTRRPLASRFVPARPPRPSLPPRPARPPSAPPRAAIVSNHYKKAGCAVPGTAGRGRRRLYTGGHGLGGGFHSDSPRRRRRATPARTPPAAPRHGPDPSPAPPAPGCAGSQADAPAEPQGRTREGSIVDFAAAANIWAKRGHRRRLSPEARDFSLAPGRQEGRGVEGWPRPVPGLSRRGGDGAGGKADGVRDPGFPERPGWAGGVSRPPPRAPSPPSASGFFLGPRRPDPPD